MMVTEVASRSIDDVGQTPIRDLGRQLGEETSHAHQFQEETDHVHPFRGEIGQFRQ